jgi:hypothetical protein
MDRTEYKRLEAALEAAEENLTEAYRLADEANQKVRDAQVAYSVARRAVSNADR